MLGRTPPSGAPPSLPLSRRARTSAPRASACRAPLYLAIRARIYDVSAAWAFYGPGKSYHGLVGRDATHPNPVPNSNPNPNRNPNRNPDPDPNPNPNPNPNPHPNQVGRDATRAFCTGCLEEVCLITSLHGLTLSLHPAPCTLTLPLTLTAAAAAAAEP